MLKPPAPSPTPWAVPEYCIKKLRLEFIMAPNWCVWTSCSSSVPLVFISRKQRVKFTGSSYSTFCNKICTCRVFYRHKANLVCIKWRNSRACNASGKLYPIGIQYLRKLRLPYLLQDKFERGWYDAQHQFSTSFATMLLLKQVQRFCSPFYRTLIIKRKLAAK